MCCEYVCVCVYMRLSLCDENWVDDRKICHDPVRVPCQVFSLLLHDAPLSIFLLPSHNPSNVCHFLLLYYFLILFIMRISQNWMSISFFFYCKNCIEKTCFSFPFKQRQITMQLTHFCLFVFLFVKSFSPFCVSGLLFSFSSFCHQFWIWF